jgi:hypothetical protein
MPTSTLFLQGEEGHADRPVEVLLGKHIPCQCKSYSSHLHIQSHTRTEKIFNLDHKTWSIYSVVTICPACPACPVCPVCPVCPACPACPVCPAKGTVQVFQVHSGHTIQVQPGCFTQTMNYVLIADKLEDFIIEGKQLDWAPSLVQNISTLSRRPPRTLSIK